MNLYELENSRNSRKKTTKGVAESGPFDLPGIDYDRPGDTPRRKLPSSGSIPRRHNDEPDFMDPDQRRLRADRARVAKANAEYYAKKKQQGVAEGLNDTVYPNAEVIKSKNGKPVGEIYQDASGWGCFHYGADRGYDGIDSREDAIQELKDLHQEARGQRPDYTIKGVAEGSLKEFAPPGDGDGNGPDEEEILFRLAKQWWLGTEPEMIRAERTLASMGWEIGEDEGYDEGGVFVVRAGDVNGNSYMSWSHNDLDEVDEGMVEDATLTESTNIIPAEQIWDYVGGIHPKDQQGGGFLKSLIMKNPEYKLKRVPLSSLHIPNEEDEGNDPYNRAMWVDVDHAREYSQHQVDKKPVVVDSHGHILDGAHRAWAASELLGRKDILAYVPVTHRAGSPQDLEFRKKFITKKQDVAEDRKNYNGIDISFQQDEDEVFVKASAGGRELGHVLFVVDGEYLMPQDLEVEERFRGQGIAQTMYDYVKSKGYKIRRSGQQTDAGAGFWDKHKGSGVNVWEQGVAEGRGAKQEIEEFLDSLSPDDVGVEQFGNYRVHYEGFTDDCKSSGDYQRNPDAVYQQVYRDFIQREGGRKPVKSSMVGSEEYPILYSVFRVPQSKTIDTPEKAYDIAYKKKQPWPRGSREEKLIRSNWQLSGLYDQYVLKQGVAEEQLDELFQQGKQNWTWKIKADTEAIAKFTVGDRDYMWMAYSHFRDDKPNKWEIQFRALRQSTDPEKLDLYGKTGTGNSAQVMSTAVDITRDFLQYYGDSVQQLSFDAKEDSRIALYRKMVQRLLPNWEADEDYSPEYGLRFTLNRPKSHQPDITEAFDQPYPIEWSQGDHGDWDAYAELADGTGLEIAFLDQQHNSWMVDFFRDSSTEITGEGDAYRVFATVLTSIRQFIDKQHPAKLNFSAEKQDDPKGSRSRLYDRMIQRYIGGTGYNLTKQNYPDGAVYSLTRSKPAVAEDNDGFDTHIVMVTVSDPGYQAVTHRGELKQRRCRVRADNRESAIETAIKWYRKQGYRVHDHHYVGAIRSGATPRNEDTGLNELSNELLGRYKKELGVRASAADAAGDYNKGHEYFKKINKATIRQGDNDARKHERENQNDMMETRLNMMRKAGYDL